MDCIHQNGGITGYSVRYGVGGSETNIISVPGGTTTETTISGLQSSTTYSVGVAAVNDAGTGVYSMGHQVLIGSSETIIETMSTAAIVGGGVAIVLIIVVAVTIIIVVTIIMRSRHGRYSLKKKEM